MISKTRVLTQTLKSLACQVRNSSYFVRRGAINWATFPFSRYPRAISIIIDDSSIFGPVKGAFDTANISLEMFTHLADIEEPMDLNDELMEELREDAAWILQTLMSAKDTSDNCVIYKLDRETRVIEASDSNLKVQGIVVTSSVTF